MANIIRILRSATSGSTPTAKTEGEPFYNEADKSFGVVDAAGVAQDLVAVRHFSALAAYAVGAHAINAGILYRCITAIAVPGAFDPTEWAEIGAAAAEADPLSLHLTGGIMTGQIALPATAPVAAVDATPKSYVDAEVAALETDLLAAAAAAGLLYLPLTAGAAKPLTGELTLAGDPTTVLGATPKQYVDTADDALQLEIDRLAANLIFVGSIDVTTDACIFTIPSGGTDGTLPAADATNLGWYLINTVAGAGLDTGEIPTGNYAVGDWLASDGASWTRLPLGQAAVTADQVALVPDVNGYGDVQAAVADLFAVKLDSNSILDAGTYP